MGGTEIGKKIEEVIKTIYNNPKDLSGTGMVNDDGTSFMPVSQFNITYDAQQNQLEPIYYWALDFLQGMGLKVEKIVDNFMSSPGSGHFSEMGQRATLMQDKAMQIFGALNQTVKSALNLVYDLREFKIRLKSYETYRKSKDKKEKEAALLGLKQIWLDSVDLPKRQQGSIHQLSGVQTGGYTTLREAFMVARSQDDLKKMHGKDGVINEQVARILKPRLQEFYEWVDFSEKELQKRYSIEKSYLKSQVSTIQLYSAWIKPYLEAAEDLRQQGFEKDAALVKAFSTTMFRLTLKATVADKKAGKSDTRNRLYKPVLIVDLMFRGHLNTKVDQRGNFAPQFGGRVEMDFYAYALNSEEMQLIEDQMNEERMKTTLRFDNSYATDTINELVADFKEFLGDKETDKMLKTPKKKDEGKKKNNPDDINPFAVMFSPLMKLFGGAGPKKLKKGEKITDAKQIKKDNWKEKQLRVAAAEDAAGKLFTVYDIYKKSHGMASTPEELDYQATINEPSTNFSDVWRFENT